MHDREELNKINHELRSFSKRFYVNEFLQGLAVYIIGSAILALILSIGELMLRNESGIRQILFYAFATLELIGFAYLVLLPILKIFGKAGAKNQKEMSQLVGQRVKEIDDKLLNVLVLSEMQQSTESNLLSAAIKQKSDDVMKVPFHKSATVKKGKQFMQGAGLVLTFLIITGLSFPDIVNYGTKRLFYYDENIEPPAPFRFVYESSEIQAVLNEALEIEFRIEGEVLPKRVFIEMEDGKDPAVKKNFNTFSYTVQRVKGDFKFNLYAEGYSSGTINVTAIERPSIRNFAVNLYYPAYLNQESEELRNIGNHNIPDGTKITWSIESEAQDQVILRFGDEVKSLKPIEGMVVYDSIFRSDALYWLSMSNVNGLTSDSISYKIEVIPDGHPDVEVGELRDSLNFTSRFAGRYSDDHGISQFRFGYFKEDSKAIEYEEIKFDPSELTREFIYEVNWSNYGLERGSRLRCFFEVWDNDGVNGRKFTRSREFYLEIPDEEALKGKRKNLSKEIEQELEEAVEESKELNKEIDDLRKELIQKKKLDWADKKQIEDLLRRNEELKQKMNKIEEKNARKNTYENKLNTSPEFQEKREELQRLMEDIMDEEMLRKIRELEELMDKISREQLNKEMEDMEISSEQLEKELERSLELFRQLEFEMKLDEAIEEIEEIKNDQEELRNETEKDGVSEEGIKEQKELEEKFKKWEEDFSELHKKNEKLENKHGLEKFEEEQKEVEKSMQEASESLQKNQKKKSSGSQKSAEDNMEKIKSGMMSLQSAMQEQSVEDLQSLRNTLENLIELSFNQEELMGEMNGLRGNDPRFNDLTKEQRAILESLKIVEDSLSELSKRITEIEPIVNRELGKSKQNMDKALKAMTERRLGKMALHQQHSMTALNNLALLLDEIVDQLQQQMMQSAGQCKKPGNSKPSSSSMQQLQKDLNKQLEQMKKMMEQGKKDGKGKGEGSSQEAESLAKMAAQQAKIRAELRKLQEGSSDKEARELKKLGDLMEETERDIVNREIRRATLLRQEQILTKLLESELAEKERDTEERREAEEGVQNKKGNLLELDEYYNARNAEHEKLMKENITYRRYYKQKVEDYFKHLAE